MTRTFYIWCYALYRIPCEYTNIIYCYTLPNFAEYANLDNITHTKKNEELKEQERNKLMCRACNFQKREIKHLCICIYISFCHGEHYELQSTCSYLIEAYMLQCASRLMIRSIRMVIAQTAMFVHCLGNF